MNRASGPGSHDEGVRRLGETLTELPRLVASLAPERLDQAPEPGQWSARAVLAHLADSEQVQGVRLRLVLAADHPPLEAWDQEAWAARFGSLEDVDESLQRWSVLRRGLLRLLETLSEDDWRRCGLHSERGEESVEATVARMADHDHDHLQQLRSAAAEARASTG